MKVESEHPYTEIVWEFGQREGRLPSKPPSVLESYRSRINSIIKLAEGRGDNFTTGDIYQALAIPPSTATPCLRLITDAGVLERISRGKRTWYHLAKSNPIPDEQME